jgi:hypothetical protein
MFDFKINLHTFLYSLQSNIPHLVSLSKNYYDPLTMIINDQENYTIQDYIYTILDSYISTNVKKIPLFLLDVEKQEKLIVVHYVCRLPIGSKVTNAYNISYEFVANTPIIKKALMYV